MTGLLAAISTAPSPISPTTELEALLAAYQEVRGADQQPVERRQQGRVAAAVVGRPGERAVVRLGDDGVGATHGWTLGSGSAHAVDGRPLTTATGLPDLADVDGQFALVAYDADADEALVANDPMGMYALYVAERDGTTYVSTSSVALARLLRADGDRLALQTFLLTGYHFGGGSNWTGVERLEPATAVRVGRTGRRDETYWRPALDPGVGRLSFSDSVDSAIGACVEVLQNRFGGGDDDLSIDLTGGFDSRLMALLLHRAGVGFTANTRESPDRVDIELAGRMARAVGWPWEALYLPQDWPDVLPSRLQHSLAWGDATLEVLQLSRVLHAHERLAQRRSDLLSAGGGEHFQWYAWETEFVGGLSTKVNYDNWIDMRLIRPVDSSVLAGSPKAAVREDLRRRMSAWAEPYRGERNTTQLDVLYAYKSTGHFGAYRSSDDGLLRAQLPFYFRRVFETAFSTNYRYRNSHRLMRHMIERLHPEVAALPTTRGGPAQPWRPSTVHRFLPYYGKLARKAVTKVSGRVLEKPLLQDTTAFAWAPRANASVLDSLDRTGLLPVSGELRSASLYDVERLRGLLARAGRPDFREHALLGRVITVELALAAADVGIA